MLITVAICTWNRSKLLDATLLEMEKLRIPAGVTWELLVVDNNSKDDTAAVIQRHTAKGILPIRGLFEPKPGHSNARNCAMAAARGELVIWTDDDVLVDADWIEAYYAAVSRYPDAAFFGGTVDPLYEVEPTSWMRKHRQLVEGPFALRQLGPEVRPLVGKELPFGANMALRWNGGGEALFDPKLGRQGNILISGDETAVFESLRQQGKIGIWVGNARVRHFIPKERINIGYIWKFWAGIGATNMRRHGLPEAAYFLGMPRWMIRKYVGLRLGALVRTPVKNAKWADLFKDSADIYGAMCEARKMGRSKPEMKTAVAAQPVPVREGAGG